MKEYKIKKINMETKMDKEICQHQFELSKIERDKLTYAEAKQMLITARGALVDMLDWALEFGDITQRERDIVYFRVIDWNSLENTGRKFQVTRERIRQIEAKVEEKMRYLFKIQDSQN